MRKTLYLLAAAATFTATPALAQIGIGVGGRLDTGAGVRVDPARTVDPVTGTVGRAVDASDRRLNRTLDRDLVLATRADIVSGASVSDSRGRRIGTVQSVQGDSAVVVQGARAVRVPVSEIYRRGSRLVTRLTSAQLRATADVEADADVRAGRRDRD